MSRGFSFMLYAPFIPWPTNLLPLQSPILIPPLRRLDIIHYILIFLVIFKEIVERKYSMFTQI